MNSHLRLSISGLRSSLRTPLSTLALVLSLGMVATQAAQAQTFTVLHTFMGERDASHDGAGPTDGVVLDRFGNLYGVTQFGGLHGEPGDLCSTFQDDGGCGTVFKLTKHGSSFLYSSLYKFQAVPDGNFPEGLVIGPDSTLFGTTNGGGIVNNQQCLNYVNGCGIVFRLQPPATFCATPLCPWNETVLHSFTGMSNDGGNPANGDLIFDSAGNIYGTTIMGGSTDWGTAYELTPSQGGWTENIFYNFDPSPQGLASPGSGLIRDQAGNFYGTTGYNVDGNPSGAVYQLVHSQSGWTANALQIFQCVGGLNGCYPGTLIFDPAGNLLMGTDGSGFYHDGTVIELVANNNWSIDLLYTFLQHQGLPSGALTRDAAGNLYGTASYCAGGLGCVYKLTPSGGGYVYSEIYDFTGRSDGQNPSGHIAIDANGNLYGTAQFGGDLQRCLGEGINGCGTVWEITP